MDLHAQKWMRAWLVGAAALGWISADLVTGQEKPTQEKSLRRILPSKKKTPTKTIQTVSNEQPSDGYNLVESDIEQQLRLLYEKDGREMPDMNLSNMTATQPTTTQNHPPVVQPNMQPQVAPQAQYAAPPPPAQKSPTKSPNKFTSFFKRIIPGGKKTEVTNQPRRQLPPTPPQPPNYPNQQPIQSQTQQFYPNQQPQVQAQPQQFSSNQQPQVPAQPQPTYTPPTQGNYQPVTSSGQPAQNFVPPPVSTPNMQKLRPAQQAYIPPAPTAIQTKNTVPALPATTPTTGSVETTPAVTISPEFVPATTVSAPAQGEPIAAPAYEEEEFFEADEDEEMEFESEAPIIPDSPSEAPAVESPLVEETSPIEAMPPQLNNDFPDPFGDPSEQAASPEDEVTNPYTGKALEEPAAPAEFPETPNAQEIALPAGVQLDEAAAAKMRRVIQRTDMKGLKGFCPVTLRDKRELADSRSEFTATYRGQKFFFASKVAQNKFEDDPSRYAPAAYGADVVLLVTVQDVVEGTLDYAAWYKGRLYLFSSEKTHDLFVMDPEKYATPPGID